MNLEDLISDTEDFLDIKSSIPACPVVAMDIKKEIEKGFNNADFDRITELVGKDVALAGKIIELMNSPFYRRTRGEVTSIRAALNFMGLQSFYGVALTMIVQQAIPQNDLILFEKFWPHSLHTANVCKLLADNNNDFRGLQDQMYLIGLFHDFGIPFLSQLVPAYSECIDQALSWGEGIDLSEIERFKTNHCLVGYVIAKSWHLPEAVREVILSHHTSQFPDLPGKEMVNSLKALLILAEFLLHHYQRINEPGSNQRTFSIPSPLNKVLKLSEKEIIRQKEAIFAKLKEHGTAQGKKG